MKTMLSNFATGFGCVLAVAGASQIQAQSIFVDLLSDTALPTTLSIAAPAGYGYSAAAPVAGTIWNTVGKSSTIPQNTTPGSDYTLYSALPLVDSLNNSGPSTLTIVYHSTITTGTRTEPSTGNGENVIQPGGVMQRAWRNYYNAGGNYYTFTISGLSASTPFDLYFEGGTGTSGQGAGLTLSAGSILGANPSTLTTVNNTPNSNGAYGSLFTSTDGGSTFQLVAQGMTWDVFHGQSDASGNFSFMLNRPGTAAYLNGFQLVAVPEPTTGAILLVGWCALGWFRFRQR